MATTTLKVEGMTCGACTSSVQSGLDLIDGVGSVSVSLTMERAVILHDPERVDPERLKEAIEDRGFDAEVLSTDLPLPDVDGFEDILESEDEEVGNLDGPAVWTTTLSVEGMTCGACTSSVEGAFKNVSGVRSVSVSLVTERAVVEHDPSLFSAAQVAEAIEDAGFDAKVLDSQPVEARSKHKSSKKKSTAADSLMTTTVSIEGMTCGACTSAVETGFKGTPGVIKFNISLLAERAVITHDPAQLSPNAIKETIEDRGFDAEILSSEPASAQSSGSVTSIQLKIFGLQNVQDSSDLEERLVNTSGVARALINPTTNRANVTYDNSIIGLRRLVEVIEEAGFNSLIAESDDNNAQLESLAKTKEIHEWRRSFKVSLFFAIPVFLTSMIFPMLIKPLDYGSIRLPIIPGLWLGDVVCLVLTIPVQFGIGKRFYISAYKSVSHGSPTMDVLVVLGTSAAFFFSVGAMIVSILTPPHSRPATVFDTSTMLITFITLGRLLENGAKSQTSAALSRLMSLAPSMATIYADPIAAAKLAEAPGVVEEKAANNEATGNLADQKVVPTELIEVGDVVILRPGDKVPADGIVIYGQSYIDESMVTGEALPISKKTGSLLMAGTVNGAGRLDFRVTRAGRDTQLSQIVRLVQEAQTSRAPIQRMADLVAGYFVPIIISLGAITFVAWMILSHALPNPPAIFLTEGSGGRFMVCLKLCISVIVFACPCALGLATPTSVMVGTGVGAENGILVKGGAVLETATTITRMVFDKTGTLTTGKMSVARSDVQAPPNEDPQIWSRTWWSLVGLTEMSSEHPIGRAIVKAAKEALNIGTDGSFDGAIETFEAVVGKGVAASVRLASSPSSAPYRLLIGNASFMLSHNIALPKALSEDSLSILKQQEAIGDQALAGTTTIHTAVNGHFTGSLYLSDTIKPSSAATITALRLMGIPSTIVTGDSRPTALAIAKALNIPASEVQASCTPSMKQEFIRDLQAEGHVVGMVGDGINDSPALATADVGISLASGTDVAMEAADVVLMRGGPNDLIDVAAALHLSRKIFRRIKMNLLWACGYNLIGLPFAMGFFLPWGLSLPPMAAGAAMALSSVSVVVSSLLLKTWKKPKWMEIEWLETEGRKPPSKWSVLSDRIRRSVVAAVSSRKAKEAAQYVPLHDMEADSV